MSKPVSSMTPTRDHWPICANCEAGLSETDIEMGECTQCHAPITTKEDDDDKIRS